MKDQGKPYTIFSHFLGKARSVPVRPPNVAEVGNLSNVLVASEQREISDDTVKPSNQRTYIRGGRPQALEVLATLHQFVDYATARDYPAKNATTRFSVHHKFGTCSIHAPSRPNSVSGINSLLSCFGVISTRTLRIFFPHVFGSSFHPQYNAMGCDTDPAKFSAWCAGGTGFPILNAGMRELNAT